jgi:hypothetical protein
MDPASMDVRKIPCINANGNNDDSVLTSLRNLSDLAQRSRCSPGLVLRPGVDAFLRLAVRPTSTTVRTMSLNFLVETAKAFPAFVVPRLASYI